MTILGSKYLPVAHRLWLSYKNHQLKIVVWNWSCILNSGQLQIELSLEIDHDMSKSNWQWWSESQSHSHYMSFKLSDRKESHLSHLQLGFVSEFEEPPKCLVNQKKYVSESQFCGYLVFLVIIGYAQISIVADYITRKFWVQSPKAHTVNYPMNIPWIDHEVVDSRAIRATTYQFPHKLVFSWVFSNFFHVGSGPFEVPASTMAARLRSKRLQRWCIRRRHWVDHLSSGCQLPLLVDDDLVSLGS